MKSKLLKISALLGILLIGGFIYTSLNNKSQKLVSPGGKTTSKATVAPSPTPTPQEFRFDKSTDLKAELESVNPKVSDSGFEELKKLTASF